METFAQCDPAEFAPTADGDLDVQVWTDQNGERVPTSIVRSRPGPEHCGWQRATFLTLGRDRTFIRDPGGLIDEDSLRGTFRADAALPDDAVDTGYRHAGRQLWVAADDSAAFLVASDRTERWPATSRPVLCY
ncbi:MAG: hypothetical protein M3P83_00445 [Actinomycetota bacterium]|nr:hypothetical protein [Actinomycetota bacterium]